MRCGCQATNELRVKVEGDGGPDTLLFEPHFPLGSTSYRAHGEREAVAFDTLPNPRDTQIRARIPLSAPWR